MKSILHKMIDHPFATVIVVWGVVDGVTALAHNMKVIAKS